MDWSKTSDSLRGRSAPFAYCTSGVASDFPALLKIVFTNCMGARGLHVALLAFNGLPKPSGLDQGLKMQSTYYTPTEEEMEQIDHAAMTAAMGTLKALDNGEIEPIDGIKVCLAAFKVARDVCAQKKKELLESKEGFDRISHFENTTEIVCTALVASMTGCDPEQVASRSVAGYQIALLIKASKAINAMSQLSSALEEDTDSFGTQYAGKIIDLADTIDDQS
jgi:hypothetical protein